VKSNRTMTDILSLAAAERAVVNYVLKQRRSSFAQIAQHTQTSSDDLQPMLDKLVADGFLSKDIDVGNYQIAVRTKPHRPGAEQLWDAISG